MKIEKLRLKGFTGIKRGLGLDEINIDFGNVAGLVAFAGANGLGKSTLLENLHPFNTLASRSGALFNHVAQRDSEKDLSFTYNSHSYRTLLKIDSQSGKSEGFIWKDGQSEVNGKISAYSKYMTDLFGSTNLFFNSVFCAQNATKLSDMTTSQLKSLFAEFLRLDRLQDYEETSKQMINIHTGKASQIDTQIEVLRKRMEGVEGLRLNIVSLMEKAESQKAYVDNAKAGLQAAQEKRGTIKEALARNEVLCKQADELGTMITGMQKNRDQESRDVDTQLNKLRERYKELAGEIAEADGILASAAAIHAHAENKKAVEELIEAITAKLEHTAEAATDAQAFVTRIEKEIADLKAKVILPEKDVEIQALNLSITSARHNIETREHQLKALEVRDQECTSNSCSFIVAALKAQDELPGLKDALHLAEIAKERRSNELIAIGADIGRAVAEKEEAIKHARRVLKNAQDDQSTTRQELATKRRELAQYQNVAEKLAALAVAKSKKDDRVTALVENKAQGTAISEAWKVKKAGIEQQVDEQRAKLAGLTLQIDERAAQSLKDTDFDIDHLQKGIAGAEKAIAETDAQIRKLQADLDGIAGAKLQIDQAQENRSRILADVADWIYIRNACGKNGLQAMEIDGAAPIITGFANDLLSRAFGSLYTVKFRTQDDDGKECLDIVTISEDGEEVLLDNLSGGQKTWILMALRLAMTLLSKEKSGLNFQTAFFDELDGALDPDNAQNFVSMYKSFMDVGHFDAIPFISHKPECRNMADHVLMFEAGKNPYWN